MTLAARSGDGPTGPFPGGRLSGQLVTESETRAALKAVAFAKYESYEFGDGWAGRNLEFLHLVR